MQFRVLLLMQLARLLFCSLQPPRSTKLVTTVNPRGCSNRYGFGPPLADLDNVNLRTNGKRNASTLGEFVLAAYRAWGARRAKGLVHLAVNAHLIVFRGRQRFVFSEEPHDNLSFKLNAK